MVDRIYGSVEDVRREISGKTGFDEDIEETLIERIAEIEKNDGVVKGLTKGDLSIMGAITVIAVALFVTVFLI